MALGEFGIATDHLVIRPLVDSDSPTLYRWLNDPKVLQYYEGRDKPCTWDDIYTHYLSKNGDPLLGLMVILDGQSVGYVQVYPLDPVESSDWELPAEIWPLFGMDLFIGECSLWNRGIGSEVVGLVSRRLLSHHGAKSVVVDPRVTNYRAIHVYKQCGFRIIKRLSRHELHEGQFHDCWLMLYQDNSCRSIS